MSTPFVCRAKCVLYKILHNKVYSCKKIRKNNKIVRYIWKKKMIYDKITVL